MGWFEMFALKNADIIVSNLQNYKDYLKTRGIKRECTWISNGVDNDSILNESNLDDKPLFKIPVDKFIVGYIGSLGRSNSIDCYLEAIKLVDKRLDIVFLFVGDGEFKNKIVDLSFTDSRIMFFEKVSRNEAFEIMKKCTVLFRGNPNVNLYKYGISPIKLFEYMLSGRPILHSTNVEHDLVHISNSGISVASESKEEIALAISSLYKMSLNDLSNFGENGKKYVIKHFSYKNLALKYSLLF